jgi:hypothetical protein
MIANPREFRIGVVLMLGFAIVLALIFSPIFKGKNGLEYADSLYNSISKGSAYYIPHVTKEAGAFTGNAVSVTLSISDERQAVRIARLLESAGAQATITDAGFTYSGDLGKVLANCIADADAMYHNDGEKVSGKYDCDERLVLHDWWTALKETDKDLKKQMQFDQAACVYLVKTKAVETAYNYYQIEPERIADKWSIVALSLVFYVVYTVWYGFAIMYLFEGLGLKLGH